MVDNSPWKFVLHCPKHRSYRGLPDQYLPDAVHPMTWTKNTVTFPNGKEWTNKQKWLETPDPQGHEDTVRYLTYGCAFRLVDGVDKKFQTYHAAPDTHPTIWICMCSRKCMACYDISDKNTTPRDEHLKNMPVCLYMYINITLARHLMF